MKNQKLNNNRGISILKTLLVSICLSLISIFSCESLGAPALWFTGGTPVTEPSGGYLYGWEFNVLSETRVDQLGFFDSGNDGLSESHEVGIWDPGGSLLRSATISAGSGATLIDGFRYVDISDVLLPAATGYVIGTNNMDVDPMISQATSISTVSTITWVQNLYAPGSSGALTKPTTNSSGYKSFFGPNFTTTVPEPASIAVFGLFLAVMGIHRKKRTA